MEVFDTIPQEIAALIPETQLKTARANLKKFSVAIASLKTKLDACPGIGKTRDLKDTPALFHFVYGGTDIYICEYDRKNQMFGYKVTKGNVERSKWGLIKLSDILSIQSVQIDFSWSVQSIEAVLYKAYPYDFKIPPSLTYV